MGLRRPAAARRPQLPGADPAETAAGASRIGNWALTLWLLLLTVAVVLLDALTGNDLPLIPLLVVLPALASVFCTVRQTTAVAVWVMLVVVGSRIASTGAFWDVVFLLGFTALASALGVVACAARIRHATEMARLRSAAVALQRQILRPLPIVTRQVRAHGLYEPIEEDRFVGGDIYEVVQSPYGTRVIIGDVQGKGLPAIGAGFAALGAFREAAVREPQLTAVADAVEDAVVRHNAFSAETGEEERFVTALLLCFDDRDRALAVNCGHLPPRLLHGGAASTVPLRRTSVPLGMADLGGEARVTERVGFPSGAALLVFTDGVTEARDAAGNFYPFDERLGSWAGREPDQVLDALQADLQHFSGGVRRDDVAVLVLSRSQDGGGDPAPGAADRATAVGRGPGRHGGDTHQLDPTRIDRDRHSSDRGAQHRAGAPPARHEAQTGPHALFTRFPFLCSRPVRPAAQVESFIAYGTAPCPCAWADLRPGRARRGGCASSGAHGVREVRHPAGTGTARAPHRGRADT